MAGRDFQDVVTKMERQETAFNTGNRYAEKFHTPAASAENAYKKHENKKPTGFSNKYHGEKYSKPIWGNNEIQSN